MISRAVPPAAEITSHPSPSLGITALRDFLGGSAKAGKTGAGLKRNPVQMVYLKEDEKKDSSPLSSNFINGFSVTGTNLPVFLLSLHKDHSKCSGLK